MLSCIRAHRPFVPVDAHWPRQRAREAIKRLNSPFIVATGDVSTVGICEDHTVLRIGCWDPPTDIDPIVIEAGVDYPPADSLVYGFFTSGTRSAEHTSELQSLMRISYAVFCLNK